MFVNFFYLLREHGVGVTPTAFLRLQKALQAGLITTLDGFYTAARSILVKSERHFDLYDRIFAHYFQGQELELPEGIELEDTVRTLLRDWLKDPKQLADVLGIDEEQLQKMSPEELI
ncbi:MAG: hypothetical protein K9K79_12015, partial [Desulfohalobiaceae bacterium]|nr:hypothetical protein [Desulfohalobiaceae bacterium]